MDQQELEPPVGGPYVAPEFVVTVMTLPYALPMALTAVWIAGFIASCVPFAQDIDNVDYLRRTGYPCVKTADAFAAFTASHCKESRHSNPGAR